MTGLLCFPCVINHPAQVEMTGVLCFPCVIYRPAQVEMTGLLCFPCVINRPAQVDRRTLCFPRAGNSVGYIMQMNTKWTFNAIMYATVSVDSFFLLRYGEGSVIREFNYIIIIIYYM